MCGYVRVWCVGVCSLLTGRRWVALVVALLLLSLFGCQPPFSDPTPHITSTNLTPLFTPLHPPHPTHLCHPHSPGVHRLLKINKRRSYIPPSTDGIIGHRTPKPSTAPAANPLKTAAIQNAANKAGSVFQPRAGVQVLLDRLKSDIKTRGVQSLIGLQRKFREVATHRASPNGSGSGSGSGSSTSKLVNLAEFKRAFKGMYFSLGDAELRIIFEDFDLGGDGVIDTDFFLRAIRTPLTGQRLACVRAAFAGLGRGSAGAAGAVEATTLAAAFDPTGHPDVVAGRVEGEKVFKEFLETFDVGGVVEGQVTEGEFINYYSNVGAHMESDEYFISVVGGVWGSSFPPGNNSPQAGEKYSPQRAGGKYSPRVSVGGQGADPALATAVAGLKTRPDDSYWIDQPWNTTKNDRKKVRAVSCELWWLLLWLWLLLLLLLLLLLFCCSVVGSKMLHFAPHTTHPTPPQSASREADHGVRLILTRLCSQLQTRGAVHGLIALQRALRAATHAHAHPVHGRDRNSALSSAQGSAQGSAHGSAQGSAHGSAQGSAHGSAQVSAHGSAQGSAHGGAPNRWLNLSEFSHALKGQQLSLGDRDLRLLFEHFDVRGQGLVDYMEMVRGVRRPLDGRRLQLVSEAFARLDVDGRGAVEAGRVIDMYDPSVHPDVLLGTRTAEGVMDEWLASFDVGSEVDGMVTKADFINYYANAGAFVTDEDYFEVMVNAWKRVEGGEGGVDVRGDSHSMGGGGAGMGGYGGEMDDPEDPLDQYADEPPYSSHLPSTTFGRKSDIGKCFEKASNKRFTAHRNQSQISFF